MKKLNKKQIVVIVLIALILLLNILAFAFMFSENETLKSWSWICFALAWLIPFFIYFHFLVLNWIRKTHEVDELKENMQESSDEDENENE